MSGSDVALMVGETIASARIALARSFAAVALDSPELDARILIGHALGLAPAGMVSQGSRQLTTAERAAIATLAQRRLAHEPVARIVGVKEFWGLPFALNAETLVPRPETETVVEAALAALGPSLGSRRQSALRIADLGTGSGALLAALLSECPAATGVGTDLSVGAIACARRNARALQLQDRTVFTICDYGAALKGPFDLLVSNPPYVRRGDIPRLQPEVRLFEPARALDGGVDGLHGYRAIASDANRLLAPNGLIVVELGAGQAGPVASLFSAAGLAVASTHSDLAGVARALSARLFHLGHESSTIQSRKKSLGLWRETD
jgi:release factor glutamine methyltransferase